jgi:hypothetical protein
MRRPRLDLDFRPQKITLSNLDEPQHKKELNKNNKHKKK